jgi:PAS domain S-box-containing protein
MLLACASASAQTIPAEDLVLDDQWPWEVVSVLAGLGLAILALLVIRQNHRLRRLQGSLDEEFSDRRRAENKFVQTDQQYRTLLDALPLGVALLDTDFFYQTANASLARMLRTTPEEITGQHVYESLQGSQQSADFYPGIWALATHQPAEAILDQTHPDGQRFLARLHVSPILDNEQNVAGLIQIVEDITSRKQTEDDLHHARQTQSQVSRHIQTTLLDGPVPPLCSGASLGVLAEHTAHGGGCFHEMIRYDDTHFDLLLGRVRGEGITAAMLAASVKILFLRAVNRLVYSMQMTSLPTPREIVTLGCRDILDRLPQIQHLLEVTYLRFDTAAKTCQRVALGYDEVFLVRPGETSCRELPSELGPLSADQLDSICQENLPLAENDLLVFFCPGLLEHSELEKHAAPLETIKQQLLAHATEPVEVVIDFIRQVLCEQFDDSTLPDELTLLAVRLDPTGPNSATGRKQIELRSELTELLRLREFVRQQCAQENITEDISGSLELAANEVASNIMIHSYAGQTDKIIRADIEIRSDRVLLELHHWGQPMQPGQAAPSPTLDGSEDQKFGFYLIRNCVDEIRHETVDDHYCIRMLKLLPSTPTRNTESTPSGGPE